MLLSLLALSDALAGPAPARYAGIGLGVDPVILEERAVSPGGAALSVGRGLGERAWAELRISRFGLLPTDPFPGGGRYHHRVLLQPSISLELPGGQGRPDALLALGLTAAGYRYQDTWEGGGRCGGPCGVRYGAAGVGVGPHLGVGARLLEGERLDLDLWWTPRRYLLEVQLAGWRQAPQGAPNTQELPRFTQGGAAHVALMGRWRSG